MKSFLVTCGFMFFTLTGFSQDAARVEVLEPGIYKDLILPLPEQFVDVRTAEEFQKGHIKGAENIDFLKKDFLVRMEKFDREEPLYIYCRSGNRSGKAAVQLSKMGFKKVIDLKGGYKAWIENEHQK